MQKLLADRRVLGGILASLLVVAVLVVVSADDTSDGSGTITSEAVLAPDTRVVADEEVDQLEILPDHVIIPDGHELADATAGDVIAAGITDQTPNGLLRLVTAVVSEDGRVVTSTRQAALEEAFEELHVSASVPVTFGGMASGDVDGAAGSGFTAAAAASGVVPAGLMPRAAEEPSEEERGVVDVEETDAGFVVSLDEVLHDGDEDTSTTDDQVSVSGSVAVEVVMNVELDVDVNLDLMVPTPELNSAKVEIHGAVATDLQLDARQASPPIDRQREVFAIEGNPVLIPAGPIVVPIRTRIPVVVGWEGRVSAAASTSASTSADLRLGVAYDDDGWAPIQEFLPEHDFNPPALDSADPGSIRFRVGPRFEVRVWESLLSGSIGVDGTLRLDLLSTSPWTCLHAGYRLPVGFEVLGDPVFDRVLDEQETLLVPDDCEEGASLPEDVVPVAGYSRVFGTCTPLGAPVGEAGRMVAALPDGGVIVAAGMTRNAPRGSQEARFDDLWLLRLDAAGEILWTRTYQGFVGDLVALVPTGDGAVVALETGRMLFLDHQGEIVDARRLGGLAFLLRGLTGLPGGSGFLALGVEGTSPVVAELGPDGSVRWARRYTGDIANGGARAASPHSDGDWNVAIGGGDFLAVGPEGRLERAVRLRVDDRFDYDADPKAAGPDGSLGAMVDRAVVITDAALENAVGSGLGPEGWGHVLHGAADGDFVAAGSTQGLVLGRVARSGGLRWAVGYESGDPPSTDFLGVTSTSDRGLVAVGRTWSLAVERCGQEFEPAERPPAEQWDLWVVKVPATGLIAPPPDSGLQRASFEGELVNRTYELVPVEADDEPFPLEVTGDDPVPVARTHPFIGSHLDESTGVVEIRTIPAGRFEPDEPLKVTYLYSKGGTVSERVTVAWNVGDLSVTHFEADVFRRGSPQGTFRYVFGPGVSLSGAGCYLESPSGCDRAQFNRAGEANGPFFPPSPLGNSPRFEGALPPIEVDRTEVVAGLETACGTAIDEVVGQLDLCVHEETGAVLYAHTVSTCNDRDRTSDTCVEIGAVEVGEAIPQDFRLPGG